MIRTVPLVLGLALSACAGDAGHTPSLAPRPIEQLGFDEPTRPAPAIAQSDPRLDPLLAEHARAAADRARRAEDALAEAERRVARAAGAAAGSDAWLDAHISLGALDVLRAEGSEALSALEQAAVDRGVAGQPPYPRLDQAIEETRGTLGALSARIDVLQRRLAQA